MAYVFADTNTPLRACFKIPIVCASLTRLFFIYISSEIMPGKSGF